MLLRSMLFVPALRTDLYDKALRSKADALIFDLEDTVPNSLKEKALELLSDGIRSERSRNGKQILVRVNSINHHNDFSELKFLRELEGITGFLIPKIETPKTIEELAGSKLLPLNKYLIFGLIETPLGVLNCKEIASQSMISGLAFGCEDFLAETGGDHRLSELALHYPRNQILIAARAYRKFAIDTVHVNINDHMSLEKNINVAKCLGFDGMLCLTPKEVEFVNKKFSPDPNQIRWAEQVIKISEHSPSSSSVQMTNKTFVGPPLVKQAKRIMKLQKEVEKLP